eukprot:scaffold5945_cov46-Phaeocystis_antarctica.AAC.2
MAGGAAAAVRRRLASLRRGLLRYLRRGRRALPVARITMALTTVAMLTVAILTMAIPTRRRRALPSTRAAAGPARQGRGLLALHVQLNP